MPGCHSTMRARAANCIRAFGMMDGRVDMCSIDATERRALRTGQQTACVRCDAFRGLASQPDSRTRLRASLWSLLLGRWICHLPSLSSPSVASPKLMLKSRAHRWLKVYEWWVRARSRWRTFVRILCKMNSYRCVAAMSERSRPTRDAAAAENRQSFKNNVDCACDGCGSSCCCWLLHVRWNAMS